MSFPRRDLLRRNRRAGPPWNGNGAGAAECATLTVPLDHDDPSSGTIELEVARRRASRLFGQRGLLVYGPAIAGVPAIQHAEHVFSSELLNRFDLVSWNLRGVSQGTEVACVDDPGFFGGLDPTPDTPEEEAERDARFADFVAGCVERSGDLLPHVSTVAAARDLDLLRAALGAGEISYLGQSYGGWLGAVYANLFPDRVRAMVLDGPPSERPEMVVQVASVVEEKLNRVLDECAESWWCRLNDGGDPHGAFDDLMLRLDSEPLVVDGQRLGEWEALLAVGYILRWDAHGQELIRALANARDGDGTELLELGQNIFLDPPALGADLALTCSGFPSDAYPGDDVIGRAVDRAPRMGISTVLLPLGLCTIWPVESDPLPPFVAAGAGPILVIGTTGDIATPLEAGRDLAAQLEDGVLLIVDAPRHTAYKVDSFEAECVRDVVDAYLVDLELPADGSVCVYGHSRLYPPD